MTLYRFICNYLFMFKCPPCASKALPREYRGVADKLFPQKGFAEGKGPSAEAAVAFANPLGVGDEYKRLWAAYKADKVANDYLENFQNNLDLLIQKTWVEKADEARKNKLQDKIPSFIKLIKNGDYPEALEEFGAILEELAYLFFGAQSQKDDFTEYALRIDPQIGLFWWYGGQINGARGAVWVKTVEKKVLYALLLLGICYLLNF